MKATWKKGIQCGLCIILCEAVGMLAGLLTSSSMGQWYLHLAKPSFNPPSWVFGPAWTILYAMMGVTLYLLLESKQGSLRDKTLKAFFGQLALNFLWSVLFFGLKSPLLAFIDILFLWAGIAWTIILSEKVSRPAAWMMYPYLAWVSFATILNGMIVWLNQ